MPDWYHVSEESAMETLVTEIRLLASRIASLRSILLHLALLAAFGIWIPQMKGLDFLDSQILAAYACIGLLFAGPSTAQAFSSEFSSSFQQATARIFTGVLYGETIAVLLGGTGIATVYLTHRGGYVPQPDWETLARCALFGLGASAMLASLAALAAVRFSKSVAMICLRLAFFGLLILYFYKGQRLIDVGLTAAGACLAIAGIFIALLGRAYR
jgi:hypothetical protein